MNYYISQKIIKDWRVCSCQQFSHKRMNNILFVNWDTKINLTLTSKDWKFPTLEFRPTSLIEKAFRATELPIRAPMKSKTNSHSIHKLSKKDQQRKENTHTNKQKQYQVCLMISRNKEEQNSKSAPLSKREVKSLVWIELKEWTLISFQFKGFFL
jgi:hypothetical protein